MKKIFLVVRWPVGGIRTFINYIYGQWDCESVEFHILVPKVRDVSQLQEPLKALRCVWHFTESEKPTFYEFMRAGLRIVREHKFSLVHAHGFTAAMAMGPMLPFMQSGKIFTAHEMLDKSDFSGIKGRVKKFLISMALNRFDTIHSVSNDAEDNLLSNLRGLNPKKCIVLHSGIDTDKFYTAKPIQLRSHLGYSTDEIIIGFFGRFMPPKGFSYLIGAMRILEKKQPGKYRVVCFGAGAFIREEQHVINQLGLNNVFHFHDFVPNIAPYIKSCDMVVMPSLSEAYGLLAAEVLSSGVPLIASSCPGLREVCADSPAIMVSPANSEELASAIERSWRADSAILKEYAGIARHKFSIDITRDKLRDLYSDLAR